MRPRHHILLRTAGIAVCLAQGAMFPDRLDGAPSGLAAAIPTVTAPRDGYDPLPADVVMNRRSVGEHLIYRSVDDYWIPYALFIGQAGLREAPGERQKSTFATTLGSIPFDRGELKDFDGERCISFSSLRRSFLVDVRFNARLSSALLDIPWAPIREISPGPSTPLVPDVSAPSGSLSFLSIDAETRRDFEQMRTNSLRVQTGGRAQSGVWDVDLENSQGDHRMELRRYHWTVFSDHVAFRAGSGANQASWMTPNNEFTGLQFGWNNRDIISYLDASGRSATDVFVSKNRNQFRTIEGNGPAAGIAELRFDNKIVSRIRIRLDGKFAFENVRMIADPRKTEVYIYERSAEEKPFAVLNYSQSVINGSLPGREVLVRGGIGCSGNPLATWNSPPSVGLTGFGQVQYGLNDRVTIDAAAQHNPVTSAGDFSAGTTLSLGDNWASSLYGSEANHRHGADLRLEGNGKSWDFGCWGSWNERDFGYDGTMRQEQYWLRFSKRTTSALTFILQGRAWRENESILHRFLLPGTYVSLPGDTMLSAVPNSDGHYRYEASHAFSQDAAVRCIHENGVASAEWNQGISRSLKARAFNEYAFRTGSNVTGLYLDWYPKNSRYDLVELGASRSGNEVGFTGKWNRYINTGFRLTLQYSWNLAQARNLVTTTELTDFVIPPASRHFFACALSWDLGFSGLRAFPIDRSAIGTTRGGLAGRLVIADGAKASPGDINDVGILLDGRRLDQRQVNGSFFVGNLKPGIYNVTVDTERLPIELAVGKSKQLVEVRNGAVTNVDIPVHALYGISGRLLDRDGNGIGNACVEVVDPQERILAKVETNEFGEYRTDGLPPGSYRLRVVSIEGRQLAYARPRSVRIAGDYLKGVELTLDGMSDSERSVAGSPGTKAGTAN
ncbi:MAG: carboxypeptidase regulatory-like domain-containing protein [Chlorobiaceae bacterium]|nr:carboxypeptidase regulatory-like domain-containing protein [Chlorobiaceae bacterium]